MKFKSDKLMVYSSFANTFVLAVGYNARPEKRGKGGKKMASSNFTSILVVKQHSKIASWHVGYI